MEEIVEMRGRLPGRVTVWQADLARRYANTLNGGSMLEAPEEGAVESRPYNTAVLFDAAGRLAATYRKIHLFDAAPVDGDTPYLESDSTAAGDRIVALEVDGLRVGLATCYDLPFPQLFRALAP